MSNRLVGLTGGHDDTWWEIVALIDPEGVIERYEAYTPPPLCSGTWEAWMASRVKREYPCRRYTVAGNPVAAAAALKELGYDAQASGPEEIYVISQAKGEEK
jgi:hypothetical protein